MERERKPYRNVCISWSGGRCLGWRTRQEVEEMFKTEEVDWVMEDGITFRFRDHEGKKLEEPIIIRHRYGK